MDSPSSESAGTSTRDTEQCEMPECDSTYRVRAARDPENNLLDMCHDCRREWPVRSLQPGTEEDRHV